MKQKNNTITLNKKILAMILLLIAIFVSSITSIKAQPTVMVSGFSITNGDASVGKDFTLTLNLSNTGTECAEGITTTIQASQPFIMRGVSTVSSGELCLNASQTVDIPLRIDPTATGGFYQLIVNNNYQDVLQNQYTQYSTLNIMVNGMPDMNAHVTGTNPVDVYAGDTATVTIAVENDGNFQAQSVNATLTSDSPLVVKWSNSFALLGTVNAKESRNAQFIIEVPKNSTGIDFPMHLTVSYLDQNLEQQTKTFYIIFYAKNKALFEVHDAGSDTFSPNENSKVVRLNLTNTGTDVAKKIRIRIEPQFPFSTDGSVRYVESLAPGQSTPASIVVNIDKDATIGPYSLNMILNYEDAQGKQLQDTTEVSLTVTQKGFLRAVFVDYWFVWILAIIIAFIIIRRRSKTVKKK